MVTFNNSFHRDRVMKGVMSRNRLKSWYPSGSPNYLDNQSFSSSVGGIMSGFVVGDPESTEKKTGI